MLFLGQVISIRAERIIFGLTEPISTWVLKNNLDMSRSFVIGSNLADSGSHATRIQNLGLSHFNSTESDDGNSTKTKASLGGSTKPSQSLARSKGAAHDDDARIGL